MTPTQIALHEAHKARQLRFAIAAARRLEQEREQRNAVQVAALERYFDALLPTQPTNEKPPVAEKFPPHIVTIQGFVAERYGLTRAELIGDSRKWKFVHPRQLAVYLAHKLTQRPLNDIGRRFGGRDHATIINAVTRVEERMAANPDFAWEVHKMKRELLG